MKLYADPITVNCRKVVAGLDLMIVRELHAARIAFSTSALFAAFAALLFCVLPLVRLPLTI